MRVLLLSIVCSFALIVCCSQEKRRSQPAAEAANKIENPYEGNYQAIQDGRRLFSWYNCAGCHSPGGGGAIGPPLIDKTWIYGSEPAKVYETIEKGRPDGMPAFGKRVTSHEIWQLVTYVRNISAEKP